MKQTTLIILLYAASFVTGLILFNVAHQYATIVRGYTAYGGEMLLLFLPTLVAYIARAFISERSAMREQRNSTQNTFGKSQQRYSGNNCSNGASLPRMCQSTFAAKRSMYDLPGLRNDDRMQLEKAEKE